MMLDSSTLLPRRLDHFFLKKDYKVESSVDMQYCMRRAIARALSFRSAAESFMMAPATRDASKMVHTSFGNSLRRLASSRMTCCV